VTNSNASTASLLGVDPNFEESTPNGHLLKIANRGKARKELFALA